MDVSKLENANEILARMETTSVYKIGLYLVLSHPFSIPSRVMNTFYVTKNKK